MQNQFSHNNLHLNYITYGNGPWVVLLHGFLESTEIWSDLAEQLSQQYSVLMPDFPGHGRSGVTENYTLAEFAEALKELMGKLGIHECILCGHSMGGYGSLEIAKLLPMQIKGIVLMHSHAAADDDKGKDNRNRTISIVKLNHTNFIHSFIPDLFAEVNREKLAEPIDRLRNRAASTSGKAIIAALQAMRDREGYLDVIMHASCPVFFVAGKEDARMSYQMIVAQSMLANHAEVLLLQGVGHMGFLEAPDIIYPAVVSFINRYLPVP